MDAPQQTLESPEPPQARSMQRMVSRLRVITLDGEYSFAEAVAALLAGRCLGIRPGENTNYVELYKPGWMNSESPDYLLRWNNSDDNCGIRTNQYLEGWRLVVVDHRELGKATNESSSGTPPGK